MSLTIGETHEKDSVFIFELLLAQTLSSIAMEEGWKCNRGWATVT